MFDTNDMASSETFHELLHLLRGLLQAIPMSVAVYRENRYSAPTSSSKPGAVQSSGVLMLLSMVICKSVFADPVNQKPVLTAVSGGMHWPQHHEKRHSE